MSSQSPPAVDETDSRGVLPSEPVRLLAWFLWAKRNPPADPKNASFAGKTVLVTGANTGLGFQSALKYAALGASSLILGARTIAKGEAAKAEIVRRTKCAPSITKVMQVEMSDFASVQAFAEEVIRNVPRLDVVLLCAGLATPKFAPGPLGWDLALHVDVLSTALLTILLLQKLRETATATGTSPHLTFVNSLAHMEAKPDWLDSNRSLLDEINDPSKFNTEDNCKKNSNIIINAACPGLCKTDLTRSWPWYIKVPGRFFQTLISRTAEQGSRALVSATMLEPESNGRFWTNDVYSPMGELITSEEGKKLYEKTWAETLSILQQHVPDIPVDELLNKGSA